MWDVRDRKLVLRQIASEPVSGYWDGGKKQVFDWEVEEYFEGRDSQGRFVRIGSWAANRWFCVGKGRSEKEALGFARKRLIRISRFPCRFELIEGR